MIKSGYASPCVDPTAGLSDKVRAAALAAGYHVPHLTDPAKLALAEQQRLAEQTLPVPKHP